MSSWVIVNRKTGQPVFETFEKKTADTVERIYASTHDVVPILTWLGGLNKANPAQEKA